MPKPLLTDAQWTRASAYLVVWKYAMPQLTNWVEGDRFREMQAFYRDLYAQELEAVFADGVEYDYNEDGTVSDDEKGIRITGRLSR